MGGRRVLKDERVQNFRIVPSCSKLHGDLLQRVLDPEAQQLLFAGSSSADTVNLGLRTVNNDACYETISQAGQALSASNVYVPVQVVTPQLCIDCRSMGAKFFISRAFKRDQNSQGSAVNAREVIENGLVWNSEAARKVAEACVLADVMVQAQRILRPGANEKAAVECDKLAPVWLDAAHRAVEDGTEDEFVAACREIVNDASKFAAGDLSELPLVALTGSAPVIFDSYINGGAVRALEYEGCKVDMPYLSSYVLQSSLAVPEAHEFAEHIELLRRTLNGLELPIQYMPGVEELLAQIEDSIPDELNYGNGWRTAARIMWLAKRGVKDFVYISTFGCLSGHVMGKGTLKWCRQQNPGANISAIEYDPGTSEVNQINRIKLIASLAHDQVKG